MGVQPEASSPCDGFAPKEHHVFYVLSHQARGKQKHVEVDYEKLASTVYGNKTYWKQSRDVIAALVDQGLITHLGDLYFQVQQSCPHSPENFFQGNVLIGRDRPPEPLGSGSPVSTGDKDLLGSAPWDASEGDRRSPLTAGDSCVPGSGRVAGVDKRSWARSVLDSESRPHSVDELARNYFPLRCEQAGIPYRDNEYRFLRNKLMYWWRHGEHLDRLIIMVDQFARHPDWCRRSSKDTSVVFAMNHARLIDLANSYEKKVAAEIHRHDHTAWKPAFMRAKRVRVR